MNEYSFYLALAVICVVLILRTVKLTGATRLWCQLEVLGYKSTLEIGETNK